MGRQYSYGQISDRKRHSNNCLFLSFISLFNDHRNINSNRWRMDSSIIYRFFLILLIFTASQVNAIEFQGKFTQGHFILGKTDPKAKIKVNKKDVKVSKDGFFVFGIDRDRKFDLTFTKTLDGKISKITKKVLKRKYNIQRIDGLAENKVTPPESVYKRIKKENNAIGEARAINSNLLYFKEKFVIPVEGIISGVYGSQRILNGKPRWPHYGIDIAAKQGTMIKSSATGVVTMAEDDLYYTGGTIIMDHGHGISTIYSHLENVLVSVGEQINQGDIIGTVGSTGRSTGPHLDFRVNWFQTRLDPMSVLK